MHFVQRNTVVIRLASVKLTKKVVCNRNRSFAPQKTTVFPKRGNRNEQQDNPWLAIQFDKRGNISTILN